MKKALGITKTMNEEDVDADKCAELKFQFLDSGSDYEQSEQVKANQEVDVDDHDFDK